MCDSTSTSSTTASFLPGAKQAASAGNADLQALLPQLMSLYRKGLTPSEKSYYTGQGDQAVIANTEGQSKNYLDQLSRMGGTASKGAAAEGLSDIARGGIQGQASVQNAVEGMDISQKQTNLNNILTALRYATSPTSYGGTSSTSQPVTLFGIPV